MTLGSASCPVRILAVSDIYDGHHSLVVIDAVDDPVGTAPRAHPIIERRQQALADTMGLSEQRTDHELVSGGSHGFWEDFTKRSANRWSRAEYIGLMCRMPVHFAGRRRIASASSSAETDSPRASSASEEARRSMVLASRKIARVSSSCSRSSRATSTAEGRPCTVTVTRSWWSCTRPTSSERWDLTSPKGRTVIVKSMTKISATSSRPSGQGPAATAPGHAAGAAHDAEHASLLAH
jgi:hypothetical protein